MELVHKITQRPWISGPVNLRIFRDGWANSWSEFKWFFNSDVDLLIGSHLPRDAVEEAEEECSLGLLDCPLETTVELAKSFEIPEGIDLETLLSQKQDVEKRAMDHRYRNFVYHNSKRCNYPTHEPIGRRELFDPLSSNFVILPEIILTVQIFRPEKSCQRFQTQALARVPVFNIDQEFLVLGCEYLTELRDRINCVSDYAVPGEYSEDPENVADVTCKDLMKSGFFYFGGVFYNDMRDSCSIDYSKTIIDWAEMGDKGIGPFTSTNMETTQFIDLDIQLGYPYVYVHQGLCEHLIVFSDLRMLNTNDTLNSNNYPMVNSFIPKKRTYCMVCHIHTAKWVVCKNKRLPEDPYFFCEICFIAFNYDGKGKKIGEFEARKYFDRTLLL